MCIVGSHDTGLAGSAEFCPPLRAPACYRGLFLFGISHHVVAQPDRGLARSIRLTSSVDHLFVKRNARSEGESERLGMPCGLIVKQADAHFSNGAVVNLHL